MAGAALGVVVARTAHTLLTCEHRPARAHLRRVRAVPGAAGRPEAWRRRNFRGRTVTLQQGPALA